MCISRLGVRSSWRFCLGTLQHWQRYPLSSTDTSDTNTLWELIINSVNRSHHNKDQKHWTLLSLPEPTPQVCRVISEDDSSANELFDQTGAGRGELQQWHLRWHTIPVHLPFKVHAELLYCKNCSQCHTRWPCLSGLSGSFYGQRVLFAHGNV